MKHIAHPIIGDATHGKGPLNRAVAGLLGVRRLWLHAGALELRHPVTGLALRLEAGLGDEWGGVAGRAKPPRSERFTRPADL